MVRTEVLTACGVMASSPREGLLWAARSVAALPPNPGGESTSIRHDVGCAVLAWMYYRR